MPLFQPWGGQGEGLGEAVGKYMVDTAKGIAEGACSIASKYPKKYLVNPYARGLISGICSDTPTPVPQPDPPPFEGGQCPTIYAVRYIVYSFSNQPFERVKSLYGKIGSFFLAGGNLFAVAGRGGRPDAAIATAFDLAGPYSRFEILSVTRTDGLEDSCGSLPDAYPDDPETDPEDFKKTIIINTYNSDGGITNTSEYNYNFNGGSTNIFGGDVNIGGSSITLDLGGISVDVDNSRSIGGGGGNPPGSDNQDEEEVTSEEGEEEVEVESDKVLWVLITISKEPHRGKVILQPNQADNDYFAGYFYWIFNVGAGYSYQLQPIRKLRTAFKAPEGITGYRAYAVNGARISVTQYLQT